MRLLLFFIIGCFFIDAVAQESPELLLNAPISWADEIIEFPIHWAPKMDLTGYEELRFHPDWKYVEKPGFWSLALLWNVSADSLFDKQKIVKNMEAYYQGLMQPNHWSKEFSDPNMLLIDNPLGDKEAVRFLGKIKVFDGFHTGEMMELYVKVRQHFCERHGKVQVLFLLSPNPFEALIWEELDAVSFKQDPCQLN